MWMLIEPWIYPILGCLVTGLWWLATRPEREPMTDPNEPEDYDGYVDYLSGRFPGLDGVTYLDKRHPGPGWGSDSAEWSTPLESRFSSRTIKPIADLAELKRVYAEIRTKYGPGVWTPAQFEMNPDRKVIDRVNQVQQQGTPPDYLGLDRSMAMLTGIRVVTSPMVPSLMLMFLDQNENLVLLDFRTEQERMRDAGSESE